MNIVLLKVFASALFVSIFCSIASAQSESNLDLAIRLLQESAPKLGLSISDIADYGITDNYVSTHNGLSHIYIIQQYSGIEIKDAYFNVNITASGENLFMRNEFRPSLHSKIASIAPAIRASAAITIASNHLGLGSPENLQILEQTSDPNQKTLFSNSSISRDPIPTKLIFYPVNKKDFALAWELRIYELENDHWWTLWVDGVTGEILGKVDWLISCDFDHNDECIDPSLGEASIVTNEKNFNGPNQYQVFPSPVESPNHGSMLVLSSPASPGVNASPFGWHDTNGISGSEFTITRGNNVHAYQDRNDINGTSNDEPDGGATLDFSSYPIDLNMDPSTYTDAAVVNLFYWCNIMHDVWYEYGFDEPGGNFQQNNYGNGGQGTDYIRAEAQDGANIGNRNNANFSSGGDGSNARIQMYLWSAPSDPNLFTVNSPPSVAGVYASQEAIFGPGLTSTPITGNLVEVNDGTASPTLGCNPPTNAVAINGNIALIDRGTCEFGTKVLNAENAGAIAVVVCNNVGGGTVSMGPGADGNMVTIPSVMIGLSDCANIRAQLPGINISLSNNGTLPELDGDLDNGIIAHEYGHGISIRLTGGPDASCLNNQEQMGEGWSDWFALIMTLKSGDIDNDPRGIGTYAIGETTSGTGIRPAPYSTDFGVNPYTYGDLGNGEISVPHGVGFIWATMLWDLTWEFINVYGFDTDLYNGTGGNNMAMQLVMDGMKIQGCSPGFIDGRTAILAADVANYDGIHECLIWEVFANRGLGFSANQGDSNDRSDGSEAFDLPPGLTGLSLVKSVDIEEIAEGANLTYGFQIRNLCETNTNVQLTDPIPSNTTYVANSASGGGTESGGVVTYPTLPSLVPGSSQIFFYSANVNPGTYSPPATLLSDGAEVISGLWNTTGGTGPGTWTVDNTNAFAGTGAWFADNYNSSSDQYLTLNVSIPLTGLSTLRFMNYYDTEVTWDGGVVEISTDNGTTWEDLGPQMILNGYNAYINANPASAIERRPAFTGISNGYLETQIRLCPYSGKNVLIRFRMATDGSVGGDGWYVDDISIIDEAAVINTATVTANGRIDSSTVCSRIINLLADEAVVLRALDAENFINVKWETSLDGTTSMILQRREESKQDFNNLFSLNELQIGSEKTFEYQDHDVKSGVNYYYQVISESFSGDETYSNIAAAKIYFNGLEVALQPNPATDFFRLLFRSEKGVTAAVQIYDSSGKLVAQDKLNINSGNTSYEVDCSSWTPGIYLLKLEGADLLKTFKLVKK